MTVGIQCHTYKKERYLKALNESGIKINFHGEIEGNETIYFFHLEGDVEEVNKIVDKIETEFFDYQAKWN